MPGAYFSKKKPPTFVGGLIFALLIHPRQARYCDRSAAEEVPEGDLAVKSVQRIFTGKKRARLSSDSLCSRYLSSQAVTRQVLSAYMSLTSVFEFMIYPMQARYCDRSAAEKVPEGDPAVKTCQWHILARKSLLLS